METSSTDLRQMRRWGGRRYFSGLLLGLWVGTLIGAFVTIYFELAENWSFFHLMGMLVIQVVILLVISAIGGVFPGTIPDSD